MEIFGKAETYLKILKATYNKAVANIILNEHQEKDKDAHYLIFVAVPEVLAIAIRYKNGLKQKNKMVNEEIPFAYGIALYFKDPISCAILLKH